MNHEFKIKPVHISSVQFAVPKEEYIPTWDPRGTNNCLEGNYYYITRECGSFHTFTIEHIKGLIKEHGGKIKNSRQSYLIYVIGRDPEDEFMESIKGCQQIKHKELFNKINRSLDQDDHSSASNYDSDDYMEID